jgi:hypothetical protein
MEVAFLKRFAIKVNSLTIKLNLAKIVLKIARIAKMNLSATLVI